MTRWVGRAWFSAVDDIDLPFEVDHLFDYIHGLDEAFAAVDDDCPDEVDIQVETWVCFICLRCGNGLDCCICEDNS